MEQTADALRAMNVALNHFYADVMYALAEHSRKKGSTAQGSCAVLRRVGKEYGLGAAEAMSLPRLTRAEVEDTNRQLHR